MGTSCMLGWDCDGGRSRRKAGARTPASSPLSMSISASIRSSPAGGMNRAGFGAVLLRRCPICWCSLTERLITPSGVPNGPEWCSCGVKGHQARCIKSTYGSSGCQRVQRTRQTHRPVHLPVLRDSFKHRVQLALFSGSPHDIPASST